MSIPVPGTMAFATLTVVETHLADDDDIESYTVYSTYGIEFNIEDAAAFVEYVRHYPKAFQSYELTAK